MLRFGERYSELVILRLKLIFSIEAVCTFGLIWGTLRITDRLGFETPSRWVNYNLFVLYQIGFIVIFLIIIAIVYISGEFIRRKLKVRSILLYDTGSDEIKQGIISLMQERPNITVGEIADIFGINIGHAGEYIRVLKKRGFVQQEGKLKNRRWLVK